MAAIVYLATNRINGKRYIGVTGRSLAARRRHHESDARSGLDSSPWFHAAIRKHGAANFDWMVLLTCSDFDAALVEEMRLISTIGPEYNASAGGRGSSGSTRTPEQRERMGAARRGKPFSDEHRRNLSIARTGKKQSAATIAKRAEANRGRRLSDEHREKIRKTLTGRKRPPEVIAKVLASRAKRYEEKPWLDLGIAYRTWCSRRKREREAISHG